MYRSATCILAGLLMSTHVSAATLTLDEALGTFGVVTQNFTGNSESEGRVFIDGNVTGNVQVNDRVIGDNGDGLDDLIITGDVINGSIKVGQSGNLTVGGDMVNSNLQLNGGVQTATLGGTRSGGNFNQNEDILVENAASTNIPEISFIDFAAQSAQLAQLSGGSVSINSSGQTVFGGSAVVTTTIDALGSGTGAFDVDAGEMLLINVAGTSGSVGLNFVDYNGLSAKIAAESVIWNFYEATDLIFNSAVFGHIVAPLAEVVLNSSNEGNVVAGSVIANNGELHPLAYNGELGLLAGGGTTAVPLPAGVVLLLSGLGLLGASRMRKKA